MARAGWRSAALPAAVLLLALAANRDAYRGYFEDDDLDTLTWAPAVPLLNLIRDIPSLDYSGTSTRPPGYFYYGAIARRCGLAYPPYAAILQILAAGNVALLWLLLRRIGLEPMACAAGCLFFAFHRALFDAWWKPMFVYDVLCTTFALLSILAYAWRRWVLSFVAFWLAMRTKEIGIAVPAILLCYEMTLGEKKWKRTLPFFLPAVVYGGFGLAFNLRQQSGYGFRFTLPALWKAVAFYSSKLLWIPYAGFVFVLLPIAFRDRRLYFGVGVLALGLAIYLLLSERLFEIYLYLAMTGAAVAVAVVARERPAVIWTFVAIWTGWQYWLIRQHAAETLAAADERRAFVVAARHVPDSPIYIWDAIPASMHSWGIEGAMVLQHPGKPKVQGIGYPGLPAEGPMLLLNWDARSRRLSATPFAPMSAVFVEMDRPVPEWQLVAGWQPAVNGHRRIAQHATARLYRPADTNDFAWEACVASGPVELRTFIEGEELPKLNFKAEQCVQERGRLKPGAAGIVNLDFLVSPPTAPVRIVSFGFSK